MGLLIVVLVAVPLELAAQAEPPDVGGQSAGGEPPIEVRENPLVSPDATGLAVLERHPLDPPDTASPRDTLQSFMGAAFGGIRFWLKYGDASPTHFDDRMRIARWAFRTLDLSGVAPSRVDDTAEQSTILLAEILARVDLPDWNEIPGPEEVAAGEIDRWTIPQTEITLERVKEGPHHGEFLFSPHTLDRLEEFWERVRHLPLRAGTLPGSAYDEFVLYPGWMIPRPWIEALPAWARHVVLDYPIWKWAATLILLTLGSATFVVAYRLSLPRQEGGEGWALRAPLLAILVMVLAWSLDPLIDDQIGMTGDVYAGLEAFLFVIFWVGETWLIVSLGDLLARAIIASPRIQPHSIDASLVRVATRAVSLVLVFVIALRAASTLGIPLSAMLTGFGVGGIAVALAARPTVENFIGSLTLYADRPVRVGDLCRFGERFGWVEDIGFRSTRIRTRERTVATIPNAVFSGQEIVNYSRRDRFLLRTTLGLRYETTGDQLRLVLTRLREMLVSHPRALETDSRVRFHGFGAYSLDVELFVYLGAADWLDYLAVREDVLLHALRIIEAAGARIAFPSQTTYLGRDETADPVARDAARAEIQRWAESGRFPFPELGEEDRERLRDTLEYPPKSARPAQRPTDDG